MSSRSQCTRCSKSIAVEPKSGLCLTCLSSGNKPLPIQSAEPSLAPVFDTRTATFHAPDPGAASHIESGQTLVPGSTPRNNTRRPLPTAPPGYEILSDLGHGGMGDVYMVREVSTKRVMAMKFVRACHNPTAIERFMREVQSLATVNHPHIVRILSAVDRPVPYFTMEFHSGGTLADRVSRDKPLAPDEAARWIASAARAVHAAHQHGIVHRDIKPSNILLAKDGSVRVSDFGLAKLADEDGEQITATGPIGTAGFMPPEQVSRVYGEIDERSDVYGLGATLYYLVTGARPLEWVESKVARGVETFVPKRPRELRSDIPLQLEAVVLKCLEKNQTDRYATAEELAEDLDRYLAGSEPEAPQLTRTRRLRRWVASQRTRLALVAVAMAAAIGLVIAAMKWAPPVPIAPGEITPHSLVLSPNSVNHPIAKMRAELAAHRQVVLVDEQSVCRFGHLEWVFGAGNFLTPDKLD